MPDLTTPSRRCFLGGLAAGSGLCVLPQAARAVIQDVSGADALAAALASAMPGTTFRLASGDYGSLNFRRGGGAAGTPVTLAAADPARPPRFDRLDLREVAHLVLEGLHFDYQFAAEDKDYFRPFAISSSRNITVRRCLFYGDRARGLSSVDNGFGWATGFIVLATNGLVIDGCEIRDFMRGLIIDRCQNVIIRSNNLHALRMDGMNFIQVRDVLIEGNHIRDFNRSINSDDHADMIQFWTTRTTAPSINVIVRANLLSSGNGWYTQSIFMRNEQVDMSQAGSEMFYRNFLIEENVIANAHLHGISVGETEGLTIRQNTLVRNLRSEGKQNNPPLWIPRINVSPAARDVTIDRNVVAAVEGYEGQADWHVAENMLVQDRTRMQAGFFDLLFEGDPANPATLRYKPGGPLDGSGIGAAMLQRG